MIKKAALLDEWLDIGEDVIVLSIGKPEVRRQLVNALAGLVAASGFDPDTIAQIAEQIRSEARTKIVKGRAQA